MNWFLSTASITVWSATVSLSALAAVPDHVAERLKGDLTPLGAERGGDGQGIIPPWSAQELLPDVEVYPDNPNLAPAPFANDPVLTTITSENADRFANSLTATHRALLAAYPDSYRMPIYRPRRTCQTPKAVNEATFSNATSAELAEGGNGVVGATSGTPFPIPNSAYEIIWNHLLAYRGQRTSRTLAMAAPGENGRRVLSSYQEDVLYLWAGKVFDDKTLARLPIDERDHQFSFFRQLRTTFVSPPSYAGRINLEWNSPNELRTPSRRWEYRPGTRRVHRAPEAAYDSSIPFTNGIVTYDSRLGFGGSPNRFNWSVAGRGEYYMPNNNNELASQDDAHDELLWNHHLNQDHARYELQRVWVLEANLKDEFEHRFHKRRFYLHEDSWQILATELYDGDGDLIAGQELFPAHAPQRGLCENAAEVTYDLADELYVAREILGQINEDNYEFNKYPICYFRPASIRASHGCGGR